MTDYPSREHQNADKAAHRRALSALDAIRTHADQLTRRLESGHDLDGSDAARFGDSLADLTVSLSALETLRDVREWHAADMADAQRPEAREGTVGECGYCTARITLLGGQWTTDGGTTACTDMSALHVPHKPKEG